VHIGHSLRQIGRGLRQKRGQVGLLPAPMRSDVLPSASLGSPCGYPLFLSRAGYGLVFRYGSASIRRAAPQTPETMLNELQAFC